MAEKKKTRNMGTIVKGKEYLREVDSNFETMCTKQGKRVVLNFNKTRYSNLFDHTQIPEYFMCNCEEGAGKIQIRSKTRSYWDSKCQFCNGSTYYGSILHCSELGKEGPESLTEGDYVYIADGEGDNIILRLISLTTSYTKNEDTGEYKIVRDYNVKSAVEVVPGVSIKGYKVLKTSIKEMDVFDAMHINSQTVNSTWSRTFVYSNACCLSDFLNKHKIFAQRTGLFEALKNYPEQIGHWNPESFMVMHLCLIAEYPTLEMLIKMGYNKLYYDIITWFNRAQSREEMLVKMKTLNNLFTINKGTKQFRIPNYIGDYLKLKAAPIDEYMTWCDIYELTKITREQFDKYINSIEFVTVSIGGVLSRFGNIIKYGYTLEQVTKYIYKQALMTAKKENTTRLNLPSKAQDMADYLSMCELLGMEANKFPSDITLSHNEVSKLRATSNEEYKHMTSVGEKTQTLLDSFIDPDKLTKMEEEYIIKVPTSVKDFVEEGNMQNSCVGHYAKKVNNDERIVFFIRKKDEPSKSFITAEYVYKTEKLGQCMRANNRDVEDKDLLNYCNVICNRIKTGVLTGKIC